VRAYFMASKWNMMDLVVYMVFLISISFHFYGQYLWPNIYEADYFSHTSSDRFIPMYSAAYWDSACHKCFAFGVVVIFFRVLEFFSDFEEVAKLAGSFGNSLKPLTVFGCFFMVAIVGFAEAFMLAFSAAIEDFSSFEKAVFACLRALTGDIDATAFADADPIFGRLMYLTYIFVVLFTLLTVLIAIISEGYETAKENQDSGGISQSAMVMEMYKILALGKKPPAFQEMMFNELHVHSKGANRVTEALPDVSPETLEAAAKSFFWHLQQDRGTEYVAITSQETLRLALLRVLHEVQIPHGFNDIESIVQRQGDLRLSEDPMDRKALVALVKKEFASLMRQTAGADDKTADMA